MSNPLRPPCGQTHPDHRYMEKACSSGGLAIIQRAELKLSSLLPPPPKPNSSFLSEIHNPLTSLCSMSTNIVIVGDMNIHVDNPSCHFAVEFLSQNECLGLKQHVDVPAHTWGHTPPPSITYRSMIWVCLTTRWS